VGSLVRPHDRSKKNKKCKHVKKPIWLALYDNYFNKFSSFKDDEHLELYKNITNNLHDHGIFEKILIVFENGDVFEFKA